MPNPTLPALLERRVAAAPDRICLWFDDVPVTAQELWDRAQRAAEGLTRLGVGSGDRYAIYMGNCREFVETWIGGMLCGALAVPINVAYRGAFLRHQLTDSGARVALVDEQRAAALGAIVAECDAVITVLVAGTQTLPVIPGANVVPASVLFERGPKDIRRGPGGEALASILYTSGTTGLSKGVALSHSYLSGMAEALVEAMALSTSDVVYYPLPLFHLSGMTAVLTALAAGCTSILDRAFSVSGTWERVRLHHCTGAVFVGPMIAMLWGQPADSADGELPLRFLGGAPIPAGLEDGLRKRYRTDLVTLYGMTEAFPLAAAVVGEPFPGGSSGRPNPGFDIRVVDEQGCDVPTGTPGEIVVRAKRPHTMFSGYYGNDKATQSQVRDGWFFTGDLCRIDSDGFLYFVDRKKDAIRRRGENISSIELEMAIRAHPDVADVAVHGVPSDLGEEDVKAVIVAKPGVSPDPEDFSEFFAERLPAFAVPRYLEFVEELPRNQVGRVLKYQLRNRGIDGNTFDRVRDRELKS